MKSANDESLFFDLFYPRAEHGSQFNVIDNNWLMSKTEGYLDRDRIPFILLDNITEILAAVHFDHPEQVWIHL